MKLRVWLFFFVAAVVWRAWPACAEESAPSSSKQSGASFTRDVVPFLKQHCYACHANGERRGDLSLEGFSDDAAVQKEHKVWENVLEMVRAGEMPPKDRPRPDRAAADAALAAIEQTLARFDCGQPQPAGRVTLRRLNRNEYDNTIRDLLGVDFKPGADFPQDDVGYGFDNIGDVLSLSPLLLEKYLNAAEIILEQAIVVVEPPKAEKAKLTGIRPPRRGGGTRKNWGVYAYSRDAIAGQRYLDAGDYKLRIEATGQQQGDEPVRAVLRIDDDEILKFELKTDPSKTTTIEANARIKSGTHRISVSLVNPFRAPDPAAASQANGNSDDDAASDKKAPGEQERNAEDRRRKRKGERTESREADDRDRVLIVKNITLDGPHNPPPPIVPESHRRVMAHEKGLPPREAARQIVSRFASRAFRRPATDEEIKGCLALYDQAEQDGERFENCVRRALYRVLVSPYFLFRVELDPPGAEAGRDYPLNEYEVASRLSYFLWSGMPDDELFSLAEQGKLRDQLEPQVRRMLADPKSQAFVQYFAGQWLTLRKLADTAPDAETFPSFDGELRQAMIRETELFFEAIVREDRSVFDLLDADFSFVNERLARHYGIEGVSGREFQRVALPANRGGILTQASILTLTSNPTRTSPVKRGKWVLDQLLNTPPPPPPADAPPLDEGKQLSGSLRQRMEQHRANALCASCHERMDPIGFAFENYDAIGRWRDKDGEFEIDPSGVLPDGQTFQGPAELKAILKRKKDLFRRCLAEKMLTYALGRGLEHYDACAVDEILAAASKKGDKFSALLVETVNSKPFQMRTATGEKR